MNALDDILEQVIETEETPSHEVLLRWCAKYPEHRNALADFFATWALQCSLPQENSVDAEKLSNRLVSHVLNTVHKKEVRLIAAAQAKGLNVTDLAQKTRLTEELIFKLDSHRLRNVPYVCVKIVMSAIQDTEVMVEHMMTGPPLPFERAVMRYKSKRRPEPAVEDFVESVLHSSLPDPDKQFWRDAAQADQTDHLE